jgi:hypothetical protein
MFFVVFLNYIQANNGAAHWTTKPLDKNHRTTKPLDNITIGQQNHWTTKPLDKNIEHNHWTT